VVAGSDVDVMLPIATPAALVATKLHAFLDRRDDRKRASDAYDIFRLLEAHDAEGAIADATRAGPAGLAQIIDELLTEKFVDDAERVVRYLRSYGEQTWTQVNAEDIRRIGDAFVCGLRD
jgi:hypothetical protein